MDQFLFFLTLVSTSPAWRESLYCFPLQYHWCTRFFFSSCELKRDKEIKKIKWTIRTSATPAHNVEMRRVNQTRERKKRRIVTSEEKYPLQCHRWRVDTYNIPHTYIHHTKYHTVRRINKQYMLKMASCYFWHNATLFNYLHNLVDEWIEIPIETLEFNLAFLSNCCDCLSETFPSKHHSVLLFI